ncbi:phospho-N-acetylmuramoyl-pentapeptide-transferase [Candidatus Poribacteria bacterium]|jgi:phospho-N-acetylmuramoyl-pentapeptide-transferase|nr:phospho-N-acetylmuramoyl-pentapeptide-transferase [Candidatus Poribacteria bacterium]MDP6746823.1 phospho-N-acetylmuramoyl-pentapeptide-transferase [Candidatus Poribacteria bacterium]MDP6994627.1 phospho-N-acetylmuramoyl-pentapeptide-transferase [Candidatus Poribacteria bacterium]
MFYHLFFEILREYFSPFNVFQYISFRAIYATITALVVSLVFGPMMIAFLKRLNIGQYVRDDGPETHLSKAGTPTMGGILIIISVLLSLVLWARLDQPAIYVMIFSLIWFGSLGFIDDYKKLVKKQSLGLRGWQKIGLQTIGAIGIATYLYLYGYQGKTVGTELIIPFFKQIRPDLGFLLIPFAVLVIVGSSNAVNLTDGLDGLAIGCTLFVAVTFGVVGYLTSHQDLASYLDIVHLPVNGEATTIFCASLIGAGIGFLWYNCHPAEVFMGDTGALALGASIGTAALLIKEEIMLVVVGGIFVMEALSVILQVWSYRVRKKRIFKMAPLHHHFEQLGWHETKVVSRFWIMALILMLIGLSTLKIR